MIALLATTTSLNPYTTAIGVCILVLAIVLCVKYLAGPLEGTFDKVLNLLLIVAGIGLVVSFVVWLYNELMS